MVEHASTLDPETRSSKPGNTAAPEVPILRILYHGDLSRVGAETTEGALLSEEPALGGRRAPRFAGRDGSLSALDDPCISRTQWVTRWHPWPRRLSIEAAASARRGVFVGRARAPAEGAPMPAGTLVEIEDRVLLWFDLVPLDRAARDRMGLVGESRAMCDLRARIATLASASSVLVQGETGTGKELVVRALHTHSDRAGGPLVPLNCAAMPAHLLESELFGHERGAFTGADRTRVGLFEQATGGTLFLDEIAELPLAMQGALLRVLQERRVRRVGGAEERPIDVRIVAASHRDLAAEVAAGRFREDLFARLERPAIEVPPLRERLEDVPLLFAAFLAAERARRPASSRLSMLWQPVGVERSVLPCPFVRGLLDYDWPRNVRELRKLAEDIALRLDAGTPLGAPPGSHATARVVARPPAIDPAHTPPPVDTDGAVTAPMRVADERPDRTGLLDVLRRSGWSPSAAARRLGVARNTVYAWMADAGLPQAGDYDRDALAAAIAQADGDLNRASDALQISLRALKLRMAALDVA